MVVTVALTFLLCIGAISVHLMLSQRTPCHEPQLFPPALFALLPYLLILVGLRAKTRRLGVAFAACWGGIVALGSAAMVVMVWLYPNEPDMALLALVTFVFLTHLVLRRAAAKLYGSLPPEAGDRSRWALAAVATAFLAVLALADTSTLNRPSHTRGHRNQVSALGSLRNLNAAARTYTSQFGNGYPADLTVLAPAKTRAPNCQAASLIDERLAQGETVGYLFEYTPGPPRPPSSPGCPMGRRSYGVSARPQEYGRSGCRSYFTDESGAIHYTEDNRPATLSDPVWN